MRSLKSVLTNKTITFDKYLTREFQDRGLKIAETLQDMAHKSLYIKMAKEIDQRILDQALSFVVDSHARKKAALFMWKVKELKKSH